MRMLRSIVFAGLAMAAVALCAAMPASAAVIHIDRDIHIKMTSPVDYPAPAVLDEAQIVAVSVVSEALTEPVGTGGVRSSVVNRDIHIATTNGSPASFVDLRRRC